MLQQFLDFGQVAFARRNQQLFGLFGVKLFGSGLFQQFLEFFSVARELNGGGPVLFLDVGVGPVFQQIFDHFGLAVVAGVNQSGAPVRGLAFNVGPLLKQFFDLGQIAFAGSYQQWFQQFRLNLFSSGFDQQFFDFGVAARQTERGGPVVFVRVGFRSFFQQELDHRRVAVGDGFHQRRAARAVLDVDVDAFADQSLRLS